MRVVRSAWWMRILLYCLQFQQPFILTHWDTCFLIVDYSGTLWVSNNCHENMITFIANSIFGMIMSVGLIKDSYVG